MDSFSDLFDAYNANSLGDHHPTILVVNPKW